MRGLSAPVLIAAMAAATTASAQGIFFPGAGPINTSMAGASTAAPVDVGASYWNPATISGLARSEFMIGSGLIIPSTHLSTFLPADSLSSTFPSSNLSGVARSNSGATAAPFAAVAFRLQDDDPMTYGIGLFSFYGGGVNFPSGAATSLLGPGNLPKSYGFGSIYSSLYGLLFAPTASYRLNDRLSVAFGPTVAETSLSLDPFFFASGVTSPNGTVSFPMGSAGKTNWGGGFQLGLLYEINESWNLGFSYKSPIWQETFHYNATFPDGKPRRVGVSASIPEIFSWGVAYKGLPKTLIDLDLRYFDYGNAALFGDPTSANGAGWRSILAVALGTQYEATDRLTLRCGYLYNQNPIPAANAFSNFQLPAVVTNTLALGGTYKITDDLSFSASYLHGFRNSIAGPIAGIHGSSVGIDSQLDTINLGFNFGFGGKRKKIVPAPSFEPSPVVDPSTLDPDCLPASLSLPEPRRATLTEGGWADPSEIGDL